MIIVIVVIIVTAGCAPLAPRPSRASHGSRGTRGTLSHRHFIPPTAPSTPPHSHRPVPIRQHAYISTLPETLPVLNDNTFEPTLKSHAPRLANRQKEASKKITDPELTSEPTIKSHTLPLSRVAKTRNSRITNLGSLALQQDNHHPKPPPKQRRGLVRYGLVASVAPWYPTDTHQNFQQATSNFLPSPRRRYELVMVAFGAPWCPWSQRLTPIWSKTCELDVPREPANHTVGEGE